MKFALKLLALADLLFIVLLSVSGSFSGVLHEILYVLSFAVPFFVAAGFLPRLRAEREEISGVAEKPKRYLSIDKKGLLLFLPVIPLLVGVIFVISYLTSLVLEFFGAVNTLPEMGSLFLMIVDHALLPSLLEELLFRYLPLLLLLPYSKRSCIFVSSLFFALIHLNLFQIPYAFVAGLILIVLDVITESILPSLVMHFVNNLLSVVYMSYCSDPSAAVIFFSLLGASCLLSLVPIIIRRREYLRLLKGCFEKGESSDHSPVVLFVGVTLILAISNLAF